MTWLLSCTALWCIALPLLGILISANICHAQRFVKTALGPGENQTKFVGIATEAEFDNETFVIAKFLGIPFAQSERFSKPEFQEPEPGMFQATEYKAICYQKKNPTDRCQKWPMSEDCLYLNVFVPTSFKKEDLATAATTTPATTIPTMTTSARPTPSSSQPTTTGVGTLSSANEDEPSEATFEDALTLSSSKLAVYIYIYGGAFVVGSANCYESSNLAGLGNVIVVTINYRLGALGFLYTKDGAIPGNLALWDQHTAIKWVKTYIHLFGGDPDRITVGGQSAGSYSSILQALYQPNDHLFHRVIAQSGTPTARRSVSPFGEEITLEVAKIFKCSLSSKPKGAEMKACLMNVGAQQLADVRPKVILPSGLPIQPILDGDFVKEDPAEVLSRMVTFGSSDKPEVPAHFTRKDLLIGIDAHDGEIAHKLHESSLAGGDVLKTLLNLRIPIDPERFRTLTKEYFQDKFTDDVDEILIDAVVDQYTDWEHPNDNVSLSNRAMDMLTDLFFAIPSLDTASSHVISQVQSSASDQGSSAETVAALRSIDEQARAAADKNGFSTNMNFSGDATTFVYRFNLPETSSSVNFTMPWFEGTHHAAEVLYVFGDEGRFSGVSGGKRISRYLMTYWTNFVKTGDPNKDDASSGVTYPSLPIWEEYDETDQSYLEIIFSPDPVSQKRLVANNRHFWSDFMPRLRHRLMEADAAAKRDATKCPTKQSNSGTNIQTDYLIVIHLVVSVWRML